MKRRAAAPESCTGKKKLGAVNAKLIARALSEKGERVAPYRCTHCGGWHVGSQLGGRRFNMKPPRLGFEEEGRRHG